ncbi:MAG: hypothetical protein ACI4PG_06155 [Candidatus Ventricola sp.]
MRDPIVLKLGEDGRVLYAAWARTPPADAILIERSALPEGDVTQYRYAGGALVHDPLPETEEEAPAQTAAERIAALERQNEMLTECLLEMSGIVYG